MSTEDRITLATLIIILGACILGTHYRVNALRGLIDRIERQVDTHRNWLEQVDPRTAHIRTIEDQRSGHELVFTSRSLSPGDIRRLADAFNEGRWRPRLGVVRCWFCGRHTIVQRPGTPTRCANPTCIIHGDGR